MKIEHITTTEQLEEVLKSDNAIIDFYKDDCMGCKMLAGSIDSLKNTYSDDEVVVHKVKLEDVGEEAFLNTGVMGTPTVFLVKNGVTKERQTGFLPPQAFDKIFVNKYLEGAK